MAMYYFHVRDGGELIIDKEGVDLPSPAAAFDEAERAARDTMAERVKFGLDIGDRKFVVRDELERTQFICPFRASLRT